MNAVHHVEDRVRTLATKQRPFEEIHAAMALCAGVSPFQQQPFQMASPLSDASSGAAAGHQAAPSPLFAGQLVAFARPMHRLRQKELSTVPAVTEAAARD